MPFKKAGHIGGRHDSPFTGLAKSFFELTANAPGGVILDHISVWYSIGAGAILTDGSWWDIRSTPVSLADTPDVCVPQNEFGIISSTARLAATFDTEAGYTKPWARLDGLWSDYDDTVNGTGGGRIFAVSGQSISGPIWVPNGKIFHLRAIEVDSNIYVGCHIREYEHFEDAVHDYTGHGLGS